MAQSDIEANVQAAIKDGIASGAVLCATDSKGNFRYQRALGERTLLSGERRPAQLDDVLFLASGTKLLTTIAALQCVEDGLLSLKGDLSTVAPDLAVKKVLIGFSEDGKTPLLEPQARPITLEMLLTHSAGLAYDFLNPTMARWRAEFGDKELDEKEDRTVEDVFYYPLSFQPGTSWMYGSGLDWAGRIVERATGKTLGECVRERIFAPLGIEDGSFFPVTDQDLRARLVNLNPDDPDAQGKAVLGGDADINKRCKGAFGGHGFFMTGGDYIKILRSLLANDGKILKPETVDDMLENHLSPEAAAGHRGMLAGPGGSFFRGDIPPETEVGHGLGGILTLSGVEGHHGERTLSWGGGLTFTWFVDRTNDLCATGAILAALPMDVGAVTELKQNFREDMYRKRADWKRGQKL
ncbi:hypothetical protein ACRE_034960 [Hapsidospora chrysogenum ATCC 11550]|uniref:Beta-lactamase-related domain-containing protein n=1 Tax=Hapsidospora chrysogenum (strain ATCC 11550 / CBS 779.69 / DSM 880 / IAM 14645 / JCM 23072 / IMI 49137) TaxID=857340 RepID=A0A086T8E9_HAPC1|nr:hypothetical protein ACRE_034960 [Hapsidospora chrysogenum ATCC 11550]